MADYLLCFYIFYYFCTIKRYEMFKRYLILISVLLSSLFCNSQPPKGLVNYGATIMVGSGATVNCWDFTTQSGTTDLDGKITVMGNITNNSTGTMFNNIEVVPDGVVRFAGINNQYINGTSPIYFENVQVNGYRTILNLGNSQVKGILSLDGIFDLNHKRLVIDNKNTNSIIYLSGFLLSETEPATGLGELQWNIGDALGIYNIPFGSGAGGKDLELIYQSKTVPSPVDGSVTFATWPTNASNEPYPSNVLTLDNLDATKMADRFWKIDANYSPKPDAAITFHYIPSDIDVSANPGITETYLKAGRYNETLNRWTDWPFSGLDNPADHSVTVFNIPSSAFFSSWTLAVNDFSLTNAFTPDNDGVNDIFMKGYEITIINRWGQKIYSGPDGWDGTHNEKKVAGGTYFYILKIPGSADVKGSVTVVSKKK